MLAVQLIAHSRLSCSRGSAPAAGEAAARAQADRDAEHFARSRAEAEARAAEAARAREAADLEVSIPVRGSAADSLNAATAAALLLFEAVRQRG